MEFKITKSTHKILILRSNKLYMTSAVHMCAAFHREQYTGLSV
jgi:hypothetical protein